MFPSITFPPTPTATPTNTANVPIPNAIGFGDVLLGGQPSPGHFKRFAEEGYTIVINLRSNAQSPELDEKALVESLDMAYFSIPIAGPQDLTRANVEQLESVLRRPGKKVLHCSSGNRVGAMMALRAAWINKRTLTEALVIGEATGLTKLEDAVRTLLSN